MVSTVDGTRNRNPCVLLTITHRLPVNGKTGLDQKRQALAVGSWASVHQHGMGNGTEARQQ